MRITLEEKSTVEFFKMSLKGETPIGMSALMRRVMYQNKASFDQMRGASHMLSARGRYYRRVQFGRLVQKIQKDYMKRGIRMRRQKIERNMLEKIGAAYMERNEAITNYSLKTKQSERTKHFEETYKKQ